MGGKFYEIHLLTEKIYREMEEGIVDFNDLITESNLIGDQLTLDLGVERARVHKKNQWLLKSNLDYKK